MFHVFSAYRVRAEETPPRIILHPSDVVVKLGNPARFSCGAEGSPEVTIEWLRNGHPLNSSAEDGKMQPSVLPDGSLLFLSVGARRGAQSHQGLYACVARNSAGKATSRNASLYIAGKAEDLFWFYIYYFALKTWKEFVIHMCTVVQGRFKRNYLGNYWV